MFEMNKHCLKGHIINDRQLLIIIFNNFIVIGYFNDIIALPNI